MLVEGETGDKSIGSNICKLHLVHVHLHWLASRPTFISFFSGPVGCTCRQEHFRTRVLSFFSLSGTECSLHRHRTCFLFSLEIKFFGRTGAPCPNASINCALQEHSTSSSSMEEKWYFLETRIGYSLSDNFFTKNQRNDQTNKFVPFARRDREATIWTRSRNRSSRCVYLCNDFNWIHIVPIVSDTYHRKNRVDCFQRFPDSTLHRRPVER